MSVSPKRTTGASAAVPPLPSWNDGPARQALVDFVTAAADPASPGYLPPEERIAVFDNDGTLWCERPLPTEVAFVLQRIRQMAPDHPEWRRDEVFAAVIDGDRGRLSGISESALAPLVEAAYGGLDQSEFAAIAEAWIVAARHPNGRSPVANAYAPMRELLAFVRGHGFRTWLCSGGTVDFMRVFAHDAYGVPPEQVIGVAMATRVREEGVRVVVERLPAVEFLHREEGKVIELDRVIGRPPALAVGNGDNDRLMLAWCAGRDGPSLPVVIVHDDAEREYAYRRGAERLQATARERGWLTVSIRDDFARVFDA